MPPLNGQSNDPNVPGCSARARRTKVYAASATPPTAASAASMIEMRRASLQEAGAMAVGLKAFKAKACVGSQKILTMA